jgi:hypothetical protein
MSKIKLDPKRLLGFKIIATSGSAMTLRSPKIGGKGCTVAAEMPVTDTANTGKEF